MANRYFVNGGVDNNWGTTGNWSLTDGGAGGQTVPSSTDDVFFTANSPNCTVNTSARTAKTLNFTGYTNTITMSQQITVSGSVTLVSAMTISGSGKLIVSTTATLTSNTKVWPNALDLSGTVTYTLGDDWTNTGLVTFSSAGNTTMTSNNMIFNGGFTINNSTTVSGTCTFKVKDTGTITVSSSGTLKNNLTIDASGKTVTFAAQAFTYNTGTLTYLAGTVVTTGSTLTISSATTLVCSGITWVNILVSGTTTITLTENVNASGTSTWGNTSATVTLNGSTWYTASIAQTSSGAICTGTTNIVMNGTGSWSVTTGAIIKNNLTFNSSGTITISGTVGYNTGTITYTAGTMSVSGSTISSTASTTWDTSGMTWAAITLSGAGATHTLTSDLKASGLVSLGSTTNTVTLTGSNILASGGLRFAGSSGQISGTTVIKLTGTGTVDQTAMTTPSAPAIRNKIIIDASGSTITFSQVNPVDIGNLLFTAGTVITNAGTWASGSSSASGYTFGG